MHKDPALSPKTTFALPLDFFLKFEAAVKTNKIYGCPFHNMYCRDSSASEQSLQSLVLPTFIRCFRSLPCPLSIPSTSRISSWSLVHPLS
ncbi:hypothetical protein J6590_048201 [Homalodisca vitripennis]|nr:hypothetical protein J6590_048201 [Homalodisca vitripennis]